jgi:hypothetical protein
MTDNVLILGAALIVAFYWIRDPQATYGQRLRRAFIMACVIALIAGTFF